MVLVVFTLKKFFSMLTPEGLAMILMEHLQIIFRIQTIKKRWKVLRIKFLRSVRIMVWIDTDVDRAAVVTQTGAAE